MKTFWQVLFTSIVVFIATQLTGQTVTIQAALTPPFSPYFADYENQMIMTLTNTSAQTVHVKLIAEITNQDNGKYVKTNPQYQPAQPIVLQPNEIKTLFANQSHTGFLDKPNIETSYDLLEKATILASGQIPEGVYDVCVQALDYTSGAVLSQPNCQVISIGYPAPPIPIMPSCNSEVDIKMPMFGWLPPVGNFANALLRYDFILVKVQDGVDPNDAMLFAIQGSNSQDVWQASNLLTTNYQYNTYCPPLIHNQNYAWVARVKDLNNSVTFQNQGVSQICTFTWKDPAIQFDGLHLPPLGTACQNDCAINVVGEVDPKPVVALNDIVKMGDFDMKIINFTVNSDRQYDRLSGMAMINVPFLNGKLARLRIQFDTIVLSTDRRVLSGTAKGMLNAGLATLIPDFNNPTWTGQTLAQTKLNTLDDYFKNLYANGENAVDTIVNTVGWEMPMGIRKNGYTVAVTQINFAPNYARMNAMVVVPLPNYMPNPSVSALGLGVGDLCMTKDKFCKEGKVFLQQDFSIDVDNQNPGNELTFKASTPASNDLTGSYMLFDDKGIKHIHIDARYDLPKSKVLRADNKAQPAQAQLTLRADHVLDWMFMAQLDSFKVKGYKDLTFHADSMFFDFSDVINPWLPNTGDFIEINSDDAWKGFYAQRINVSFAEGMMGKPVKFEIKDLIIDKNGVSTEFLAIGKLIDLNQGKMGSFNFTLDTIKVKISKNSFMAGKIMGSIRLNIAAADFKVGSGLIDFTPTTQNNLIPYTAMLSYVPVLDPLPDGSYPPSKLVFDFVVQSTKAIDIPIWAATLNLLPTSVIQISDQTGPLVATANLSGTFGFSAKVGGIGVIDCAGLKFQNWGISSNAPHFTNNPTFTLASPQKSIGAFPISLDTFIFVTQSSPKGPLFGLQFGIKVKIVDSIGLIPEASGRFSVFGRLDFVNGQAQPAFDHAEINEICVSGTIAVVELSGCVNFYNNDPKFGDGFRGNLAMKLPGDIRVGATAQFGSVNNYRYWYADAFVSPPAGAIPIFSGLELAGFGGGAYYHMKRKSVPNLDLTMVAQNATGVGMTQTGIVYEPDQSIDFGIKAKVYVASYQKRDVFNADAALEITIKNGKLDAITLEGGARFLSDKDMKGGAVTGTLKAGYDYGKGLFYANSALNASFANGLIQGNGTFDVHFEKGPQTSNQLKWHLRFGRAPGVQGGAPISLNLANLAKVETYFQAGNYQIDPMPSPPAFIADMFTSPDAKEMIKNVREQRNQINPTPGAVNIIHGGRFEANINKEFLIFYGSLQGGYGYDMLLMNNPMGCQGYPNPGIYGWYAKGNAFAGLKSIHEDMVTYTTPYQMSRMYLQHENGQPRIFLSQNFEPMSYQFPANVAITYEARFIPLSNNSPTLKIDVPNIQNQSQIVFNYPATLSKSTYYAIQLVAKWAKPAGSPQPNPKNNFTDLAEKRVMNYGGSTYALINSRVLNENKLAATGLNEMKLYEIRFRTSEYNDYLAKLNSTISEKATYKVKKVASSTPLLVSVTEPNLATHLKVLAAINAALGMPATYKPIVSYMEEVHQRGPERFDYYDLNGYTKTMPSGIKIVHTPHLVSTTSDIITFHTKLKNKLVKILQVPYITVIDSSIIEGVTGEFSRRITGSPTIKLTWEEGITQQVPNFTPSFAGPNDFLFSENANTTVGTLMNGSNLIKFKSNWIPAQNPYIFTGNFMSQNGYQPQSTADYERIGQAMDAVDEEINALQTDNLTPKPTVKSATRQKAATGSGNGATGGNE